MLKSLFGKYRFLVISITLFLIFDLGVLVLNFYTSGKIAQQTELINLAGRQRTLTQQMSKATLYIKAQKLQQWVYQSGLDELRNHYQIFSMTLAALNDGGQTSSAETGELIDVQAVSNEKARAILSESINLWREFETVIEPLMVDILITDEEIKPASQFIAANNLALFDLMNRLTDQFTAQSAQQTAFLRTVQVVGISLATINFFIILFHFLGQLRARDRQLYIKQRESDQILATIDEGVFLVNEDLIISRQHSSHLETIFASKLISGRRLPRFFQAYLSEKTTKTAVDFVNLYFASHVNSELIEDLNPLKRVPATVTDDSGVVQRKYLNFTFAPIETEKNSRTVLVTVKDITDTILLEEHSDKTEALVEQQLAMFSQILPINPDDLDVFLGESLEAFERLNTLLKDNGRVTDNCEATLNRLLREVHTVKGNAAVLRFNWFAERLHHFENEIEALQKLGERNIVHGRNLLPLTVLLKQLYENVEFIGELRSRLLSYGINHGAQTRDKVVVDIPTLSETPANRRWQELQVLTQDISEQEGVKVRLNLRGFDKQLAPSLDDSLYAMAVQLIRNAIVHGIESDTTRQGLKKPEVGQIVMSLSDDGQGNYRFVFEDDGRGFNYQLIRDRLKQSGVGPEKVNRLSKADLVRRVFLNRFSTHKGVSSNAGRGVGLAIVWEKLKSLGGQIKVRSIEREFTQFTIDFQAIESSESRLKAV